LLRKLKPGTVLFVKSIDRLGRNYDEIIEQWRHITRDKQADIVVLDTPLLDTRQRLVGEGGQQYLTGVFLADMLLQLMSYIAETERNFIRQRQAEGIAIAQAKGVKFGRPVRDRPHNFAEVLAQWQAGELSGRAAARELGIAHRTFTLWVAECAVEEPKAGLAASNG
jgi:DNA invertase Pin-like site-specific DNA recombinase